MEWDFLYGLTILLYVQSVWVANGKQYLQNETEEKESIHTVLSVTLLIITLCKFSLRINIENSMNFFFLQ